MKRDINLEILAEKIKQHDQKVFPEFYLRHMPFLHTFASRYTFDAETSRDLVHDAFLFIWENPDKIDTRQNIVHLLRMMVRNNCLNYLRKLRIEDSHSDRLVEAILLSSENYWLDDPDDDDVQLRKRIRELLDRLSEKQRSVLLSHFAEGKKIGEVAKDHGISESTVKTHLKRAAKIIREHLSLVMILTFFE